ERPYKRPSYEAGVTAEGEPVSPGPASGPDEPASEGDGVADGKPDPLGPSDPMGPTEAGGDGATTEPAA
ncbi:MAG: hypothetical protein AAGK21_18280, partial [Bacteroidota bacterium]